jgi:hypothetical protein
LPAGPRNSALHYPAAAGQELAGDTWSKRFAGPDDDFRGRISGPASNDAQEGVDSVLTRDRMEAS